MNTHPTTKAAPLYRLETLAAIHGLNERLTLAEWKRIYGYPQKLLGRGTLVPVEAAPTPEPPACAHTPRTKAFCMSLKTEYDQNDADENNDAREEFMRQLEREHAALLAALQALLMRMESEMGRFPKKELPRRNRSMQQAREAIAAAKGAK